MVLPLLMRAALADGDAAAARAVAGRIGSRHPEMLGEACRQALAGRLAELEGFGEAARRRYAAARDDRSHCGADAGLRLLAWEFGHGQRDALDTAGRARAIATLWHGDELEQRALELAAEAALRGDDLVGAIEALALLGERFSEDPHAAALRRRAADLVVRLFAERGAAAPPQTLLRWRERFAGLLDDPRQRQAVDLASARRLLADDRFDEAARLLDPDEGGAARSPEAAELLARAQVGAGRPRRALATLARIGDVGSFAGWRGDSRELLLEARLAAGELDAVAAMATALDAPLRTRLARAFLEDERADRAMAVLRPALDGGADAPSAAQIAHLVVATYLSDALPDLAGDLRRRARLWQGTRWQPLIERLLTDSQRSSTATLEQRVARILARSDGILDQDGEGN